MDLRLVYPPDRFGLGRIGLRELEALPRPDTNPVAPSVVTPDDGGRIVYGWKQAALSAVQVRGRAVRVWTAGQLARGWIAPPWHEPARDTLMPTTGLFPDLEEDYLLGIGGGYLEAAVWADDLLRLFRLLDREKAETWCWYGQDEPRYHVCGGFIEGRSRCVDGEIDLFVERRRSGSGLVGWEDCLCRLSRRAILKGVEERWPAKVPAEELLGCRTARSVLERVREWRWRCGALDRGHGRAVEVAG